MKVSKILIKGFQQFENFQLDLTNPETGEPLDKICLIGPNGTGKSTILNLVLRLLNVALTSYASDSDSSRRFLPQGSSSLVPNSSMLVEFCDASSAFIIQVLPQPDHEWFLCYDKSIESNPDWQESWYDYSVTLKNEFYGAYQLSELPVDKLTGREDVMIHEPSDQSLTLPQDPPQASLNEALHLFQDFPIYHMVSVTSSSQFWKILAYLLKKWESDYLSFLHEPENADKSIRQLEEEFSANHQKILPEIAQLWDRILAKCGLEFDLEKAIMPVQLHESLQAYVKSKNTGKQLTYNQLSSGIRNYIFKLGYIKSLYFDRQIKRGFLLIDEPENSLYPDLLYDLIDDYLGMIQNTQMFVATHSPIIAGQFEPYERFHLDFDDRGYVTATRGVSPAGDDPNDLLYRDFQVRSIYGKKGLEKWNRFLELRKLIAANDEPEMKQVLMQEYLEIGNAYNFPVPR